MRAFYALLLIISTASPALDDDGMTDLAIVSIPVCIAIVCLLVITWLQSP